jgi:hypothetical protein
MATVGPCSAYIRRVEPTAAADGAVSVQGAVGAAVGAPVGAAVGASVGSAVGALVGDAVGKRSAAHK